jgi:hypothetical protein
MANSAVKFDTVCEFFEKNPQFERLYYRPNSYEVAKILREKQWLTKLVDALANGQPPNTIDPRHVETLYVEVTQMQNLTCAICTAKTQSFVKRIVFMGEFTGQCRYSFEMFAFVTILNSINPDMFVVLHGHTSMFSTFGQNGICKKVQAIFAASDDEKLKTLDIEKLMRSYFQTLPLFAIFGNNLVVSKGFPLLSVAFQDMTKHDFVSSLQKGVASVLAWDQKSILDDKFASVVIEFFLNSFCLANRETVKRESRGHTVCEIGFNDSYNILTQLSKMFETPVENIIRCKPLGIKQDPIEHFSLSPAHQRTTVFTVSGFYDERIDKVKYFTLPKWTVCTFHVVSDPDTYNCNPALHDEPRDPKLCMALVSQD